MRNFSKMTDYFVKKTDTHHIVEVLPFYPNHFSACRQDQSQTKHNNNKNTAAQIFTKTKFTVAQTHREPIDWLRQRLTWNIYLVSNRKLPTAVIFPIILIHGSRQGTFYHIIFLFTLKLFLNIVTISARVFLPSSVCLSVSWVNAIRFCFYLV